MESKIAVITGASSGIGKAVSKNYWKTTLKLLHVGELAM